MRTAGYTLIGLAALLTMLPALPFIAWGAMQFWSYINPSSGFRTLSANIELEPGFPYFLAFYVLAIATCIIGGIVCLRRSGRESSHVA